MPADINAMPACEAAKWYQEHGFYVHPLNGKIPILKAWQERTEHLSEHELTEYFETKNKNIGLVCGEKSDTTVIDRDHIPTGLWQGLELSPVRQSRTEGRDHLFYRYCAELPAAKYHALGFEILNGGNNCVLAPSIHPTGDKYQLTESPDNRPVMPMELIERIKSTVSTWNALQLNVSKCRNVFQAFFKAYFTDNDKKNPHFRDMSIFHGATGRELTLYLFSELKAAGATNGELHLLCMLMFLDSYSSKDSEYQIGKIKATATARAATIQAHPILSQFYDFERDHEPTPANTSQHRPTPAKESLTPEEMIRLVESAKRQMVKYKNQTESARQLVCKQVWKDHGLDGRIFKKAYDEVFSQKQEETEDNEDPLSIYPAHIIKQAYDILLHGDPKKYIIDTWNKSHIGDRNIGEMYASSYASTFILNSDGIHIKPGGGSGKGKSSSGQKYGNLIPRDRFFFGSMSGKAALYHKFKPGTVICLDDTDYGDDLISLIKQSTTEFQHGTKHRTVKDQAALEVSISERCAWWLNSVAGLDDEQLTNRFISADVDSSTEQDERVFEQQIEEELTFTAGDSDDVLVCRCMYSMLGLELYDIRIPLFSGDRFTWQNKDNRRNFKMFKDIIRSVTLYKIYQREKIGNCYISTVEDFDEAVKIYQSIAEANYTKLNNTQKKAMECMVEQKRGVDRKTLMKRTGISQTGVKHLMHGKNGNGGLLSFMAGLSESWDSERRCMVYDYNGDKFGLVSYERIAVLNRDNIEATINEFKTKLLSAGANTPNTQETPRKHPLGVSTKTVSSECSVVQVTPNHSKLQDSIYLNAGQTPEPELTITETPKNETEIYTTLTGSALGVSGGVIQATDNENHLTPGGVTCGVSGVSCGVTPATDTDTPLTPEPAGTCDIDLPELLEACSQWETHNHTSINSTNQILAAMDIAKTLKLSDIEPVQSAIKYHAKLANTS